MGVLARLEQGVQRAGKGHLWLPKAAPGACRASGRQSSPSLRAAFLSWCVFNLELWKFGHPSSPRRSDFLAPRAEAGAGRCPPALPHTWGSAPAHLIFLLSSGLWSRDRYSRRLQPALPWFMDSTASPGSHFGPGRQLQSGPQCSGRAQEAAPGQEAASRLSGVEDDGWGGNQHPLRNLPGHKAPESGW